MYSIKGDRDLPENTLPHLPGYEGSWPVRVGNGAAHQPQLDVFGEVLDAFHLAEEAGLAPCDDAFALQSALLTQVETRWHQPDAGIWEGRGPERHYVHSKVMGWVAADRMVRRIESGRATGPVEEWRHLRAAIHADVCAQGYDPVRNTFTQSYGSTALDASLLLIPLVGFLPPDDKRVIGTIEAIQRELSTGDDGLILRYRTKGDETGADGLVSAEGAFLACSFWLVEALTMIGRTTEATALFEKLLALANDVGLLAEEYDCVAGRQFPTGFQPFCPGRRRAPAGLRGEDGRPRRGARPGHRRLTGPVPGRAAARPSHQRQKRTKPTVLPVMLPDHHQAAARPSAPTRVRR